MAGQLFTHHFLTHGITETPEWRSSDAAAVNFQGGLIEIFESFQGYRQPNEAVTEQELIRPVLELLGWADYLPQQGAARNEDIPDLLLFPDAVSKERAAARSSPQERYRDAVVVEESKRFGLPLDARDIHDGRRSRTPHGQMLRYLSTADIESEGRVRWGILTSGGVWRLYDYRARPRASGYFEADLGQMLDSGDEDSLRLVYLLFRRSSFTPQQGAAVSFLEAALAEGQALRGAGHQGHIGHGLREGVPQPGPSPGRRNGGRAPRGPGGRPDLPVPAALRTLRRGPGAAPGERPSVRETTACGSRCARRSRAGWIERRRLLGQSHHLLRPPDDTVRAHRQGRRVHWPAALQRRPVRPGGRPAAGPVRLPDTVVAPIVYDLSHAETAEGRRFVNYRDMSVQQLGSIYERLLEREPVRDDTGRIAVRLNPYARKDSGSFYTPQELVDLIVDRTLKPLAEERLTAFKEKAAELRSDRRPKVQREAELRSLDPAEAVLDLKVLDPAMGSGHFLVTAVDFLSDYIADLIEYVPAVPGWLDGPYESPLVGRIAAIRSDILRRAGESDWVMDEAQLTDQAIIRRMVLKRCIYGVDKNPLTVELAKVSLWLHSFTVGAPLSFLDHHLRCGDSLIGLSVTEATADLNRLGGLFASSAIAGAEAAAGGMRRIEEMSDADVAEVRESADLFQGVEDATADLRSLLDFLCGLRWLTSGMKKRARAAFEAPLLEALGQRPDDAYKLLAHGPAAPTGESGFSQMWSDADSIADRERFLHWEAAFPGVWRGWQNDRPQGGFDAVIGNPPWDRIKLQEVEWFATRSPELALAPTAAARRTGIQRLRAAGSPLADGLRRGEAAGRPARAALPRLGALPAAGRRRHQPVLAVRRARDGPRQARRLRRAAHAVGHLRRQDSGEVLQVGIHQRPRVQPVRLREPPARNGTAAVLPRRSLAVQVLCPRLRRRGAALRRDRVRLLPARHPDNRRPGPLLPAGPGRLRPREPEHRHGARVPHAAGRGDHPPHLRAPPGFWSTAQAARRTAPGPSGTCVCSTWQTIPACSGRPNSSTQWGSTPSRATAGRRATGSTCRCTRARMIHQFDHRAKVRVNPGKHAQPVSRASRTGLCEAQHRDPDFRPQPQYWVPAAGR